MSEPSSQIVQRGSDRDTALDRDDRLQHEAERRTLLLEISRTLLESTLDQVALTKFVFDRVRRPLGIDFCTNYQYDATDGLLHLTAAPGFPPGLQEALAVQPLQRTLCGAVARTLQPLRVNAQQIAQDERAAVLHAAGVRAYTAYPLLARDGGLLGTLSFGSRARTSFEPEETDFLQMVSHFLALAWQRWRKISALEVAAQEFRTLAEGIPSLCWMADPSGHIYWYNNRFYEYSGTTAEEMLGWGWQAIHDPAVLPAVLERWRNSLETGTPFEMTFPLRGADGRFRPFLTRIVPHKDATGKVRGWLGLNTDVSAAQARENALRTAESALRQREAELRSLNEELEHRVRAEVAAREEAQIRLAHAQRIEALGQLAGGIAHDFNNVLQAVAGAAELIERQAHDPAAVQRIVRRMTEMTQRGAAVTSRLLTFARRGALRTEPIDPAALLSDVRDMLRHTVGSGLEIRLDAPPGLPALLADKGQLETVLINLATNARDATDGQGVMTLTAAAELHPGRDGHRFSQLAPGRYIRIAVSDDGCGMSEDILARASEPFFTTKETGKGTGLGLAMARGFAEQSAGGLRIESSPGHGTTVSLWLPVADSAGSGDAAQRSAAHPAASGARILVVDDEPVVRALLADGLSSHGYHVVQAACGRDALALIDSGAPADLVVSDLAMPSMPGLELAAELWRRRPGLPVVVLTGQPSTQSDLTAEAESASRLVIIRKPIAIDALDDRITTLLSPGEG